MKNATSRQRVASSSSDHRNSSDIVSEPTPYLQDQTTIEHFAAMCAKSAMVYARGEMHLLDAVDDLQQHAFQAGLVQRLGADAVRAIMGAAFAAVTAVSS